MNERIEKLAEQAGFTVARAYGLKDTVPKDVFIANVCVSNEIKKLAELIVRECMELTKQCSTGKGIHDLFADEIIAEHFGVEE
jgi:hypothetical protein